MKRFKSSDKKTVVTLTLQREYLARYLRNIEFDLCVKTSTAVGESEELNRSISTSDATNFRRASTVDDLLVVLFCDDPNLVLQSTLSFASDESTRS